jgi:hypothetical protein
MNPLFTSESKLICYGACGLQMSFKFFQMFFFKPGQLFRNDGVYNSPDPTWS